MKKEISKKDLKNFTVLNENGEYRLRASEAEKILNLKSPDQITRIRRAKGSNNWQDKLAQATLLINKFGDEVIFNDEGKCRLSIAEIMAIVKITKNTASYTRKPTAKHRYKWDKLASYELLMNSLN